METVQVKTPDGATWEIKAYITRGDRRRIDKVVQVASLDYLGGLTKSGVDVESLQKMAGDRVDGASVSPDEDDALLANCVVSWSYGDYTPEAVLEKDNNVTDVVLGKMHELYYRTGEGAKN